jgi:glycosyltransferase involved in cell wall biosynthesis
MNVVIDATALLMRSAGVKTYIWQWLRALQNLPGKNCFAGFPFFRDLPPLRHDRSVLSPLATFPRFIASRAADRIQSILEACVGDADVFHTSNAERYRPRKARLTATIHDLTAWRFPESHTAFNQRIDTRFFTQILPAADKLIAVSESTRRDAIELLRLQPDRIVTIHSGVATEYFQAGPEQARQASAKFHLDHPYVLFVGTIEPRKNVDRLLDAWQSLPEDVRATFELVVAGPVGWATRETAARLSESVTRIHYLGYVAEHWMPGLTAGASCLAYPSLYEGFGFPVAQALAAGIPVVTSNTSSLPEVAGPAALYVDPLSVSAIRAALLDVLTSPTTAARLGAEARKQAARYTWERCAAQSLDFFESVVGAG